MLGAGDVRSWRKPFQSLKGAFPDSPTTERATAAAFQLRPHDGGQEWSSEMDRNPNSDLQIRKGAMASLPPALIGETGWDILLALTSPDGTGVRLERLARMISVPRAVLAQWLDWLEDRQLVTGHSDHLTDEFIAAITRPGLELVENYLLAASSLHRGAQY